MKITKAKLKQIIKEEVARFNEEESEKPKTARRDNPFKTSGWHGSSGFKLYVPKEHPMHKYYDPVGAYAKQHGVMKPEFASTFELMQPDSPEHQGNWQLELKWIDRRTWSGKPVVRAVKKIPVEGSEGIKYDGTSEGAKKSITELMVAIYNSLEEMKNTPAAEPAEG
jgi:hypothetical protein|tara:strand:+ start:379 stop:879 length:501 start_codon:yes stop_codon:yes gene_type:complete